MDTPRPTAIATARRPKPPWRRLWTTLASLAAIAAMFAGLRFCGATTDQPSPATQPATSGAPAPPRPPTEPPAAGGSDADIAPRPGTNQAATAAATGFSTDFADPGSGPEDWLVRISRWTSPEFAAELRSTDWRRLPAAHLTAITPSALGPTIGDFLVDYDSGLAIAVRVEKTGTQWRATTVMPVRRH